MNTLLKSFREWREQMVCQIQATNGDPEKSMLQDMLEQARHAIRDHKTLRHASVSLGGRDPRKEGYAGLEACMCAYATSRNRKPCCAAEHRRNHPATWVAA